MTGWASILVPIFSAVLGAAIGGYVVHRLAARRELQGERRAVRVEHLIRAWRAIMAMANRTETMPPSAGQNEAYENALAEVMLLGEAAEIHATAAFIGAVGRGERTNLDAVVDALRTSLRRELELSDVPLPEDRVLRLDWSHAGDADGH